MMQLVMQKIMHKPAPLSSLRSDIPAEVDRVVMESLEIDPQNRPNTVSDWIAELEAASEDVEESRRTGSARLVILATVGAEVYIDDERKGSVGRSGRVVLTDVPAGQHVLRVSKPGEKDDERVIEMRPGAGEQVIQAQLRALRHGSQPTPSQGSNSSGIHSSVMPGIVACTSCNSRFAEGVKFCGRCGGRSFVLVSAGDAGASFPCPRCSSPLPERSRFCGRCGLNMLSQPVSATSVSSRGSQSLPPQAERICRRCGGAYPPNIRFCGRCGGSMT
jgi:hypothetical protein